MPSPDKTHGVYSIEYDSEDHLGVIFKWHGSVWKRTLPYCIANAVIALILHYLKHNKGLDFGITDKGHSMMTLFVSFLVISRVSMSIGRYNEARGNMTKMYRESREFVQNMVVFTKKDQSEKAKLYRMNLAYNVLILLRMIMAVIDYQSEEVPCWTLPELKGPTKEYVMRSIAVSKSNATNHHCEAEMNMRVPIQMSLYIRDEIFTINEHTPGAEIGPWQFIRLFGSIDNFMGAYYGMRRFLTTPFPFPLVQMARTIMFIYLYTLPFAILDSMENSFVYFATVFLVTYGFIGLENVSIELDDPFGDDDNDFDNMGMMMTAFEDTFVTMHYVDGQEWMDKLKKMLSSDVGDSPYSETSALLV